MSATVAAALKKIAVAILTDKKLRKTFLGIVLGIIVIIVMPFAAIIALFNGGINIDTNRLQTLVVQNMSAEEQARLQRVEDLMYEIEDKMTEAGFDKQRVKEAQVLYVLALSDFSEEAGFVDKLVGCFAEGQTDAQLISAVNSAFGTNLSVDEFTKVMSAIRAVYISTAGYIDPSTKNNLDLVQWAKNAHSRGWGYVWGTYGQVLTRSLYKAKAEQYPDEVGGYADFIEEHWIGGRTADCVGLIKGYLMHHRGVDRDVLYAFAHKGMIYESAEYHNAVFVGYDAQGNAAHANLRGTGSESTFKGNVPGSRPEYSFHWTGSSDKLYLFEAPIDMLSYISMHKDGWQKHSYAACCGVSDRVMLQMLQDDSNIKTVCLCLDNDEAGWKADKRIADKLFTQGIQTEILVPIHKDWNEDLLFPEESEVEDECRVLQL